MRTYGHEPGIEVPRHRYAALNGGPLNGQLINVTGWNRHQLLEGATLLTGHGQFGPGGRALYQGRPGDPDRLHWAGDTP
ncbi:MULTISPECIES: hypothetical protein [Streptomyces]|uniref:hypothetical protein n=1 Tax=Streptomyces TaxID=1883 RepID=UPI0029AA302E|nr:hypothetical protein [Streptomyces sp. NRRL_B-2557]MDX2748341.1 hypothetical protein [Streptomyces sp. NRRL_B-2557]